MQRDLKIIAAEIDVQLRKVDKILTTRGRLYKTLNHFLITVLYLNSD